MKLSVFAFSSYKDYLARLSKDMPKGFLTKIANAACCQRSYISEVLRSKVQLTPDHAEGIARFLNLNDEEIDYWFNLVHYERASSKIYRARLQEKMKQQKSDYNRLTNRLDNLATESNDARGRYYSTWHYAAIHIATSVRELSTVSSIASYFRLPTAFVSSILEFLVQEEYVTFEKEKYFYKLGKPWTFLPDSSVYTKLNHVNWRTLSLSRPENYSDEVHYSSVFAISESSYNVLRQTLLSYIEEQRQNISKSGSERVAVFSCDLFSF